MTQTGTITKLQNKRHENNKKTEPQNMSPPLRAAPDAQTKQKTEPKKSRRVVEWRQNRCSPGGGMEGQACEGEQGKGSMTEQAEQGATAEQA